MDLNQLLQLTIDKKASDLHIIANYCPTIRVDGELYHLKTFPVLKSDMTQSLLFSFLNDSQKENLLANKEIDIGYEYNGYRFRINIYYSKGSLAAAFRSIPTKIKTLEELSLPSYMAQFSEIKQGLVLLTGPTGEGKSTTLASLINNINIKYSRHIITIEDPIEYVYPEAKSIISQRELHYDTHSLNRSLRSALREDPDVILIGEMRDHETVELVLTAAETGHLVFSTLHTNSSPETINRVLDIFPADQQGQIRNQLSLVLHAVIAQRLLPQINEPGRIPAIEVLINTPAVSSTIREGHTHLLNNILETSEENGLILFEKYLVKLYTTGKISKETAFSYALRPKELEKFIK